MKKNKSNENNYHFKDLWSCVNNAILDMHLRVNVNTYACILKHMYIHVALITQHWENRTPLKTERSARSEGGSV